MNGELAAVIAVVLHGNEWLSNAGRPAPSLERDNSAFRYVNTLTFFEPKRGWLRRARTFEGTAEWLNAKRDEGVERLLLCAPTATDPNLPSRIASSFANGVAHGLVADGDRRQLWISTWKTGPIPRPRGEIWEVALTSTELSEPIHISPSSMSEAATELGESLDAARSFAIANDLTSWGDWFGKAIVAAVSPDPAVPYNPDIAPDGALTLERRQLLASAVQAWVFGGMGSWNDVWLEDESQMGEMAHVSDRLYGAVMDALVAVTNNQ